MGNTHIFPIPGSVPEQVRWDFEQLSPVEGGHCISKQSGIEN